ncbi:hypothetical protein BC332_11639 [Capsicum chinense]|nr:hypothetical protein BC332_11639 [Capsicum chinense]
MSLAHPTSRKLRSQCRYRLSAYSHFYVDDSFRCDHLAQVDVIVKATAKKHNITADNPLIASKKDKVKLVSSGEWKNYPFKGFNISDESLKKLIMLINDYSEWIVDGLLKHHAGRYGQQQPKVSQNEECLINIIKGFNIPAGLPWHLVAEVYIPINYGDEFYWVLVVVILKERRIRVYNSMSRRRRSGPSPEIQKLAKILPTYLDMNDFLDPKVRTDWSAIEAYRDKMVNPFDVQYISKIAQQTIDSLDCSLFVATYAEYLSDGLQVPNDRLDTGYSAKDMLLFYGNTEKRNLKSRTQVTLKIHDDQSRIP